MRSATSSIAWASVGADEVALARDQASADTVPRTAPEAPPWAAARLREARASLGTGTRRRIRLSLIATAFSCDGCGLGPSWSAVSRSAQRSPLNFTAPTAFFTGEVLPFTGELHRIPALPDDHQQTCLLMAPWVSRASGNSAHLARPDTWAM